MRVAFVWSLSMPAFRLCAVLALTGSLFAADAPAHKPNPRLAAIQPGSSLDLGAFTVETPEGEPENYANQVTDYSGMVYDAWNHRVLLFGGGHATTFTDTIYAFDLQTLTWASLYKPTPRRFYTADNMAKGFWKAGGQGSYPRPVGRHTYDQLVVPDDLPRLYLMRSGCGPSMVAPGIGYFGGAGGIYDFATGRWEMTEPVPFGGYGDAAEFDPVSKLVVGVSNAGFAVWNPKTRTTQSFDLKPSVNAYSGTLAYDPVDQAMYGFPANMQAWRLELDRANVGKSKLKLLQPSGTAPPATECAFAWDAANRCFGGNVQGGTAFGYDPVANAWTGQPIAGLQGVSLVFHCLVYDPVSSVYVVVGKGPAGKRTYAFKAANPPTSSTPSNPSKPANP